MADKDTQGSLQTARSALSPFEEMERWFEPFNLSLFRPLRGEWPQWAESGRQTPKVDVIDRDSEILVRAEVPGVHKEDLEVSMTDNTVTIKGTTSHEEKEEKGDYYRHEIRKGSFCRTVALPGDVDSGRAKTRFHNGVLEITAPKVAKAQRRNIKVE